MESASDRNLLDCHFTRRRHRTGDTWPDVDQAAAGADANEARARAKFEKGQESKVAENSRGLRTVAEETCNLPLYRYVIIGYHLRI